MKNKILYVFFAVTALLCCLVFSASAAVLDINEDNVADLEEVDNYFECSAAGDVDGNGTTMADDARTILRISVNLEKIDTSKFMRADVDGDGSITAADARLALRLAVGLDKAPEHKVQEIVVVPATCSTEGLTVKFCTGCMKIYAKVTLPASTDNHITAGWTTVKEPTCIDKGLAQLKCITCNAVVREEELSATSRHAGEWTYPDGKDCYNPVKKVRTCTVCGTLEEKVENPQGGHSYKWITTTPKTCTQDGVQVYKCTNCGLVNKEAPLPATGHIFEFDVTIKEATCTETGLKAKKCVNCDEQKEAYAVDALGHNFRNSSYEVTKEATCAEEGTASVICSRCGIADELTIEKVAHTLEGTWTTVTEPDCTNEGTKTGTCIYCGDVEEAIPANGHTVKKWTKIKAATCYEEGIMQGECSVCGDKSATKPIEKTAHSFNDKVQYWTSGVLCKENGTGYYKCKDCDARQEIIMLQRPCNNNNFQKTRTVTQATCTTKETVVKVCDFCKEDIEGTLTSKGDVLGHDYTNAEWEEVQTANCTEDGIRQCYCNRCGDAKTETTPAYGHNPDGEWYETLEATCAAPGKESVNCSTCGEIADSRDLEKLPHTPVRSVIADSAEIDENGNYVVRCVVSCSVCNEEIETAETITRIAVKSNADDIRVIFGEDTDLTPGSTVYFSLEGDTEDLLILLRYGIADEEEIEGFGGLYSFTLPEDLDETEKVTITIFKF